MCETVQTISRKKELNNLFSKPEYVFKKQLFENPYFPFAEVKPSVFVYSVLYHRRIYAAVVAISTLLSAIIIFSLAETVNGYLTPFIFIVIIYTYKSYYYWRQRKYTIDCNLRSYHFELGDETVQIGELHNVYIRCKKLEAHGIDSYYYIVLGGFSIEEDTITIPTMDKSIAKDAKKLAKRLGINYFDSNDKSKKHMILHRNTSSGSDIFPV